MGIEKLVTLRINVAGLKKLGMDKKKVKSKIISVPVMVDINEDRCTKFDLICYAKKRLTDEINASDAN